MAEGVGDDECRNAVRLKQFVALLDEGHEEVPLFPKCLVALAGENLLTLTSIPVGLLVCPNVRRIADDHVEPLPHAEHPLRIEERGGGVLVVGVPGGKLFGYRVAPAVALEQFGDFAAQFLVLLPAFGLGRQRTGDEMLFPHAAEFRLLGVNVRIAQNIA